MNTPQKFKGLTARTTDKIISNSDLTHVTELGIAKLNQLVSPLLKEWEAISWDKGNTQNVKIVFYSTESPGFITAFLDELLSKRLGGEIMATFIESEMPELFETETPLTEKVDYRNPYGVIKQPIKQVEKKPSTMKPKQPLKPKQQIKPKPPMKPTAQKPKQPLKPKATIKPKQSIQPISNLISDDIHKAD